MKKPITSLVVMTMLALFMSCIPPALADSIATIDLTSPNAALSGYTGPFATLTIDLTSSTTATITFTSDVHSGYIYLMGGTNAVDLNVNATSFAVSTISGTNFMSGFQTPSLSNGGSGNVDGFGTLNLNINAFDGFTHSATSISFTLTNTSGTWGTANDVLIANSNGALAAIHGFACLDSPNVCTSSTGASATGFVANGGGVSVPETGQFTALLAGIVCFGGILISGRRRKS